MFSVNTFKTLLKYILKLLKKYIFPIKAESDGHVIHNNLKPVKLKLPGKCW